MIVQTIKVNNCNPQTIVIGRRGTYDTIQIAFDLSYLVESYGNGVAVLAVKRSQDSSAYPAVVTQEENTLTWTVSETDTYYVGAGEAQLMWYVDGGLAKTIIYPMVVMKDILMTSEEAPDAYQTWVDDLTALGAETLQNAQKAAQSATEAKASEDNAAESARKAEEAAGMLVGVSATATTLEPGESATAEYNDGVFEFGIPEGEKGDPFTYEDFTEAQKAELVQGPILDAQTAAVEAVNAAGTTQTGNVNQAGTSAVNAVNQAGTTQVNAVNQAGATQVQAVEDKGDEVIDSIPSDYSDLTAEVNDLTRHLSDFDPLYSTLMEQGSLSAPGTGRPLSYVDSPNAIRTVDFSPWEPGMSVHLKDGFEARLLLCDSNGNYIVDASWSQNPTSSSSADLVKVVVRRQSLTAITPDEIIQAIVSTDIPLTIVYPKANESDFTDFKAKIEAATTTLVESNAYYLENVTPERSSGILDRWNNSITNGEHYSIPVAYGERYWLLGYKWGNDYAGYYLRKNGAIVSYDNTTPNGVMRNWDVTIPDGVDELYLNSNYSFGAIYKKVPCRAKPDSKWTGKKIVWFGTSIPERSTYNAIIGYPEYVATLLGATIYNEAVGSSCARRGFKTAESADDPYGWTGMGIAALWNMGSTIAEKNEIISNWESKWRSLTGYDAAMTDEISAKALACSYENKLVQKYIIDNPVDLYVFDHGYNDWKTGDLDMNANDPFDMSTFQGAMNTYIKLILEANPRARIVIISHYEDQERAGLIEMQKGEAEYWNLPFCKIYEKLGWANNRQITTTGYWSADGVWIESGGTSQTLSLKQYHMRDGRHPNTDRTGRACMDIANIIADYIDGIAPAN